MKVFKVLMMLLIIIEPVYGVVSGKFLLEQRFAKSEALGSAEFEPFLQYNQFIQLSHIIKWGDMSYENLSVNYEFKNIGSFGVDFFYMHQNEFEVIDNIGNIILKSSIYDIDAGIIFAKKITDKINGAVKFHYIRSKLIYYNANTFAFNFYVKYDINYKLKIGLSVVNIGRGLKYNISDDSDVNPLPAYLKFNMIYKPLNFSGKGVLSTILEKLRFLYQTSYIVYEGFDLGAGVEYNLKDFIFFRFAYRYIEQNDIIGIIGGIGINYKNLIFNYAFTPGDFVGMKHKIGVMYLF